MTFDAAPATALPPAYTLLGRTGLRVSRLALGTMTFGTEHGFGCDRATARALFDSYLDWGGNFIDTADVYTQGTSERWLGEFMREAGVRDRVVLATKYTNNFSNTARDPNAAGNGRKALQRALEASLSRLGTDCIDLYYLHMWDTVTPVEEVLRSMDDLVRAGKIRHWALSDVPAWYAARAITLAQAHGLEQPCALQMEYSLVSRGIEYEFTSMCQELGIGLVPWSPLGGGLLSGKYRPHVGAADQDEGRIRNTAQVATPSLNKLTPRNWDIVAELEAVAREIGRPMAQVAVHWVVQRPSVSSVILGATKPQQLAQTLPALDFTLPPELEQRLDAVGKLPAIFPYAFIDTMVPRLYGGAQVLATPPRFAQPLQQRGGSWR
ncbi:aldo/keto reductase [Azohydromonas australica]|uniref:aldo/keto reductase n=1 Tax=Azohydromonas australica TaxID=364039 RepID=UPI00041EC733|nr:aldo/keto reductase [Azohydromonas australica]